MPFQGISVSVQRNYNVIFVFTEKNLTVFQVTLASNVSILKNPNQTKAKHNQKKIFS